MRLKSEIWVQAFLRANETQARYGAVLHKGAPEAGAVYVVINHLDGTSSLLGPPAGPAFDEEGNRRFRREFAAPRPWSEIASRMERIQHTDPDVWLVEVEDKTGLGGLLPENDD